MKLAVLGGGGIHSAFLAEFLAYNAHRIGLTEVVFLDNSVDNLATFGEITRYTFSIIRPDIQFGTTTGPVTALWGANYIITTLQIGGDENHIRDERIALQRNTFGQETTDAGGFVMAMRSVPAILRYCRLTEEHAAEDAILFSFTSPSDLVTEAVVKPGFRRRVYGTCDTSSKLIRELLAILGYEERDLSIECHGLSHFSWFTYFTIRGGGVTERLIASPELYQKTAMQYFSPGLVQFCDDQLLNEYLYHYYYRKVVLRTIQEAGETRGRQIVRINREMREALRTADARTQPEAAFTTWMQHYPHRENSYMQNGSQREKLRTHRLLTLRQFTEEPDTDDCAGVTLDTLGVVNSTTTKHIVVSIQNHDTLDFLRPDNVTEISCDLSRDGLESVTLVKAPTAQKNIISYVREYKRLAVMVILQQDGSLTVRALVVHSLIGSYSLARTLIGAYLDDEQFAAWQ